MVQNVPCGFGIKTELPDLLCVEEIQDDLLTRFRRLASLGTRSDVCVSLLLN